MRNPLTLAFLIGGALLTMGVKLSEVPIQDFSSVAGTWEEDGSYKEDNPFTPSEGVMRIVGGKIEYDSWQGLVVTVTLHEGNGKRVLKGEQQDRERAFRVKRVKKKRNKKKKKKNQTSEKKEY